MQDIILNIDVAPTLVDLAGVTDRSQVVTDGESFKPLLSGNSTTQPTSKWRTQFLIEHDGEHQDFIEGCPALKDQNVGVSLASKKFFLSQQSNHHLCRYLCRLLHCLASQV